LVSSLGIYPGLPEVQESIQVGVSQFLLSKRP
jgi:hypothetical protein